MKYTGMGETAYVEEVLKQNPSFNVDRPRAEGSKTALYLACEKGYDDIVELLLKVKADTTICDEEKDKHYSPLTIAARNGHLAVVKVILKAGVNMEARDGENRTALYAASANNKSEIVEILGKAGAKVNIYGRNEWTPLTVATDNGYTEVVKTLLKNKADPEMAYKSKDGDYPAIYSATVKNHPDIVEILCKAGAKVNVYGISGWTPLTVAANNGYTEVVKVLLKNGADLEMARKYKDGDSTAVYCATINNNRSDIVEILCKAGAKVNVYGINGWTPLTAAASSGYIDVVKALLMYGKGLDLELRDQGSGGFTPLYHAIMKDHREVVEVLCKAGASLSSYSGFNGSTPLTRAVQDKKIEIIKILLKYGADPYQTEKDSFSKFNSIELARMDNRQDIVNLLRNPPRLEEKGTPQVANLGNLEFDNLCKLAEQGDANAQYELGCRYKTGNGVNKNMLEAVNWFRKAAEQDQLDAQFILGNCYYNGDGMDEDKAEAVNWYRKAANGGHCQAQHALGDCYFNAIGIHKNLAWALRYYRKAADQGDEEARRKYELTDAAIKKQSEEMQKIFEESGLMR